MNVTPGMANMQLKSESILNIKLSLKSNNRGNIFNYIQNGILVTDCESTIVYTNPAFTRITGYSSSEILGQNPGMLHSGRHDKAFYETMWKSIKENGSWEGEIWNRRKSGQIYPEYLTISELIMADADICNYIGIFSDISYLKKDIYRQLKLAFYDPLTELPNRSLYKDRVTQAIDRSRNNPKIKHAILFMDLDKFKQVNDTYGHLVGDQLLKLVGQRMLSIIRAGDTIARVGGDEFTAIFNDIEDRESALHLAERIVSSVSQPFIIDGHQIQVAISIGISFFPGDGSKIDDLMNNADKAMYCAKKNKSNIEFFDSIKS